MQIIKACNPELWKYYLLPRRIVHGMTRWLNFVLMSKPKLDRAKMDDIRISGNSYADDLELPFKPEIYGRPPSDRWCMCGTDPDEYFCARCGKLIPPRGVQ